MTVVSTAYTRQPVIRQKQFCYKELPIKTKGNCCFYEFYGNQDFVLIPDGNYYFLLDAETHKRVLFHGSELLNTLCFMKKNGHRYIGFCLSYEYSLDCEQEKVTDALEEMSICKTMEEAVRLCEKLLQDMISSKSKHPLLIYGVKRMRETKGCVAVESVSMDKGYTTRQVERIFKKYYDCSPKTMNRYIRLCNALDMIEDNQSLSFSEISEILGYSDPSHFQREFKFFTGLSPGRFSDIYFNRKNI